MTACQNLLTLMFVIRMRDNLWMMRGVVVTEHKSSQGVLIVIAVAESVQFSAGENKGFTDL
jgi:hypothetical protein